ncbi:Prolyl 4-hydroxylase, alpha subunit [Niveomyces insectorum RCEF 264]|uniref:Prolyl 4-hydroxylase, alpha subunit n=1 Tax=Niveomyces insectorum RCEF 264 TaxID=1081102 RepID=A0A167VPK3_9HYPO|nr:Prolyl 4-hydroxylase, alpha subunit [Niveomyces insectorum RCEF 264]
MMWSSKKLWFYVLGCWSGYCPVGAAAADDGLAKNFVCQHPPYQPLLVSASPLVIYIKNFLTPQERLHLYTASQGKFSQSAVAAAGTAEDGDGGGSLASRHGARTSQSAYIPRDAVVHCIEERAAVFQGYDVAREQLEPLQLVKYGPGEQYRFHTDWLARDSVKAAHATADNGGNRLSSFFVYVHLHENNTDTTTGGGTNFPLLHAPRDERWCAEQLVNCDEPWDNGVTFRPVPGHAVFWRNLHPEDGHGDYRTLHAGLPVSTGEKIGMNIWTRQGPLNEEARGPEYYPDV